MRLAGWTWAATWADRRARWLAEKPLCWPMPMPTFVVRKEVKGHGTQKKIEGQIPAAGGKVVIIDDVVTSGDSIIKAIDATQEAGCEILLAISVLDRGAGATGIAGSAGNPVSAAGDVE